MVSLLLIISFLLHLISLFAIYQLYQLIKRQEKQDASEIAELFESYLQEIKYENEQLTERLLATHSEDEPQKEVEAQPKSEKQKDEHVEAKDLEIELPDLNVEDQVEASLESQVLQLNDQGFSLEQIARKLNRGKTEVELIVKLYKKNNTNA